MYQQIIGANNLLHIKHINSFETLFDKKIFVLFNVHNFAQSYKTEGK